MNKFCTFLSRPATLLNTGISTIVAILCMIMLIHFTSSCKSTSPSVCIDATYEVNETIIDELVCFVTTDMEAVYYDKIVEKLRMLVIDQQITPEFRLLVINDMVIAAYGDTIDDDLLLERPLEYIWKHFWNFILYEGSDYEFIYEKDIDQLNQEDQYT